MRYFQLFLFAVVSWSGTAQVTAPNLPDKGVMSRNVDSFYDFTRDYARFPGRVTDVSKNKKFIKVYTENANVKFFRTGDQVFFRLAKRELGPCQGYIRDVEKKHYFVLRVDAMSDCVPEGLYFRRGQMVNFYSSTLARRVYEGSHFRKVLLGDKKDFLAQLKKINHFLWGFDQIRLKLASDYDARIEDIKVEKLKVLENLQDKRKEYIALQSKLREDLNDMDRKLDFYVVERQELLKDRWYMDRGAGLPTAHRPQKEISITAKDEEEHRWHLTDFK